MIECVCESEREILRIQRSLREPGSQRARESGSQGVSQSERMTQGRVHVELGIDRNIGTSEQMERRACEASDLCVMCDV